MFKCPIANRIEIGTGSTSSRIFYGSIMWDGFIVFGILIWGFKLTLGFGLSWLTTWSRWLGLLSCLLFNPSKGLYSLKFYLSLLSSSLLILYKWVGWFLPICLISSRDNALYSLRTGDVLYIQLNLCTSNYLNAINFLQISHFVVLDPQLSSWRIIYSYAMSF